MGTSPLFDLLCHDLLCCHVDTWISDQTLKIEESFVTYRMERIATDKTKYSELLFTLNIHSEFYARYNSFAETISHLLTITDVILHGTVYVEQWLYRF